VCELALTVAASSKLREPSIIGVGGGAGGLARYAAQRLGWTVEIPPHAEIISSIGDALSLIRAERERTVATADAATIDQMMVDVEAEVVAAGASPASVEVRVEEVPERHTLRAIATGSVGLSAGALPGRHELDAAEVQAAAPKGATVSVAGRYWLVADGHDLTLLDRYGDEVVSLTGETTTADRLEATTQKLTRYRGPVTLRPTVWIVDDRRLLELAPSDDGNSPYAGRSDALFLVGRER
jgi:hypothetical protein